MVAIDDNRVSRVASLLSRKGTRKGTAASTASTQEGDNPSKHPELLVARMQEWKHVTKSLTAYFEAIAEMETTSGKELTRIGGLLHTPFREVDQFSKKDGLQDVLADVRDKTRLIAKHHTTLADTVRGSIVDPLKKLRLRIKAHIAAVEDDVGKVAQSVIRHREITTKLLADLTTSISKQKGPPATLSAREDPYILNQLAPRQLKNQIEQENALVKAILRYQDQTKIFEEGVATSIKDVFKSWDMWSERTYAAVAFEWKNVCATVAAVSTTKEWDAFASNPNFVLDPATPLRDVGLVKWPGMDDESTRPVKEGVLQRKKKWTKSWTDAFFVLTPAGYAHEFKAADHPSYSPPVMSLFVPACTLGPMPPETEKEYRFEIEGRKTAGAKAEKVKGTLRIGTKDNAYAFKAHTYEEMSSWWQEIDKFAKMSLSYGPNSPTTAEAEGLVPAAVQGEEEAEATEGDEETVASPVRSKASAEEGTLRSGESGEAEDNGSQRPALGPRSPSAYSTSSSASSRQPARASPTSTFASAPTSPVQELGKNPWAGDTAEEHAS